MDVKRQFLILNASPDAFENLTVWKVSKYWVISGPYFYAFGQNMGRYFVSLRYLSVFSPNAGKYRPEITLYLDTFHAVLLY